MLCAGHLDPVQKSCICLPDECFVLGIGTQHKGVDSIFYRFSTVCILFIHSIQLSGPFYSCIYCTAHAYTAHSTCYVFKKLKYKHFFKSHKYLVETGPRIGRKGFQIKAFPFRCLASESKTSGLFSNSNIIFKF